MGTETVEKGLGLWVDVVGGGGREGGRGERGRGIALEHLT
jgi:hypothetical protein